MVVSEPEPGPAGGAAAGGLDAAGQAGGAEDVAAGGGDQAQASPGDGGQGVHADWAEELGQGAAAGRLGLLRVMGHRGVGQVDGGVVDPGPGRSEGLPGRQHIGQPEAELTPPEFGDNSAQKMAQNGAIFKYT